MTNPNPTFRSYQEEPAQGGRGMAGLAWRRQGFWAKRLPTILLLRAVWFLLPLAGTSHGAPRPGVYAPKTSRQVVRQGPRHRRREISFATFNVENLYRYRKNPVKTSHFNRPGRPAIPDYIPLSAQAYKNKLQGLARTIVKQLKTPDVVALQEIENFKKKLAPEKPVLRDLAREIRRQTRYAGHRGIEYRFAQVPGAADGRGIGQGFLYRADRVRLAAVDTEHPVLGDRPDDAFRFNRSAANPKPLNTMASARIVGRTGPEKVPVFSRPVMVGRLKCSGTRWGGASRKSSLWSTATSNPTPPGFS